MGEGTREDGTIYQRQYGGSIYTCFFGVYVPGRGAYGLVRSARYIETVNPEAVTSKRIDTSRATREAPPRLQERLARAARGGADFARQAQPRASRGPRSESGRGVTPGHSVDAESHGSRVYTTQPGMTNPRDGARRGARGGPREATGDTRAQAEGSSANSEPRGARKPATRAANPARGLLGWKVTAGPARPSRQTPGPATRAGAGGAANQRGDEP